MSAFSMKTGPVRVRVKIRDNSRFEERAKRAQKAAPILIRRAMAHAVGWWEGQAIDSAPIAWTRRQGDPSIVWRGGRPVYRALQSKHPRGSLRTSTQGHVRVQRRRIIGIVENPMPYAKYLEFGTKAIAGGRVRKWRPGMPPVRTWLYQAEGTQGRTQMPFIRPHIAGAIRVLRTEATAMLNTLFPRTM